MKRLKNASPSLRRVKLSHILLGLAALYLFFISFKFLDLFEIGLALSGDDSYAGFNGLADVDSESGRLDKLLLGSVYKDTFHRRLVDNENQNAQVTSQEDAIKEKKGGHPSIKPLRFRYGRITGDILKRRNRTSELSVIERMADEAWTLGLKAWKDIDNQTANIETDIVEAKTESCPSWVSMHGVELTKRDGIMFLPCGLAAGSSITVVGSPQYAHQEYVPQFAKLRQRDPMVLVSQFMVELQGLKSVVGEDPPRILHLNPRLRGDWSLRPVIEHNTCYRMQWGTAQRCDGSPSKTDDDMLVDGFPRCEKWLQTGVIDSRESRTNSWFQRFIGRAKKPVVTWPFPFVEGKMFVLTVRAGVDGFHIHVGGRHMTSFPYRTGFTLEDATGLAVIGDVNVHSVYATALPTSHRNISPQKILEFYEQWKSPPLPKKPIQIFIGVLSATNHFAERMAVRKTWMQSSAIKSSNVALRFFVALNPRKEVNAVLKEEAAYFGDIVILPFMDRYELVVLKTIAICEFGVKNVSASYIMKCDDDNFVRVDAVLRAIESIYPKRSLYMGNLNLLHRPLRTGKWAVTYEEWPEEVYPPYANGPGYIISSDIAKYIESHHGKKNLRLFKMEDVSMGMWVEQFNSSIKPIQYSHSWKFCQYGCIQNYYTAHYQSPRQMLCLWENLMKGQARCCNL